MCASVNVLALCVETYMWGYIEVYSRYIELTAIFALVIAIGTVQGEIATFAGINALSVAASELVGSAVCNQSKV